MNSAVTAVVLLVVAAFALDASQSPPPAIAELSPQPQKQITDAPAEQSSEFGKGEGGAAGGEGGPEVTLPPTTLPPKIIERARVRRCVGTPPRQIEDPQSPPCVPYFDGDNGGATSRGVTKDEIRIALPRTDDQQEDTMDREWVALENFFNNRFEFYGRKLRFLPFRALNDQAHDPQPATQRAQATYVDEQLQVFGSLSYNDLVTTDYYDELARRKIVSVNGFVPTAGRRHFERNHPYQWSSMPTQEQIGDDLGAFACRQLAGRNADYAGAGLRLRPRRFAILVHTYLEYGMPDLSPLQRRLTECGIEAKVYEQRFEIATYQQESANVVVGMQNDGVTTVLCVCHLFPLATGDMVTASRQSWQPEWVVTSFLSNDLDAGGQVFMPKDQSPQVFGLSYFRKSQGDADNVAAWAVKEADPTYQFEAGEAQGLQRFYEPLLVLASGIQMAGPNLTPETFAAGLQKTKWPNPVTPYFQATVSFAGDHAMNEDAAVIWWGAQYGSPSGGLGTYCYAQLGRRYTAATFPSEPVGLFNAPCR